MKHLGLVLFLLLSAPSAFAAECAEYPAKLKACEKYACKFTHPFTNTQMEKKILGIVGGKCKTTEEMPNKGMMTCQFSEKQGKETAVYLEQVMGAKTTETKATVDLGSGKTKTRTTVDGKPIADPYTRAMNDGTCVISGYGQAAEKAKPKKKGECRTQSDCTKPCKNCKKGKQRCLNFLKKGKSYSLCGECASSFIDCKKGFECDQKTNRCVAM